MARAITQNKSRDLWAEVRKIKNSNTTSPNCMDDITGNKDIADLFVNKYKELFNSVKYEQNKLEELCKVNTIDINDHCMPFSSYDNHSIHTITINQVKIAIDK